MKIKMKLKIKIKMKIKRFFSCLKIYLKIKKLKYFLKDHEKHITYTCLQDFSILNFQIQTMSAFTEQQPIILNGAQGEYYQVNGFKYAKNFPFKWATDKYRSGPEHCGNCELYGCIRNVFVLYCSNCVTHIYNGVVAEERNKEIDGAIYLKSDEELWQVAPYMQGVSLTQIGDEHEQNENDYYIDEEEQRQRQQQLEDQRQADEYLASLEAQESQESYVDGFINEYYGREEDFYGEEDDDEARLEAELAHVPLDMRAALDPRYTIALEDFRAWAREQ